MITELSLATFAVDATAWVFVSPAFETVIVTPTVEVLSCAEGILFAADGTLADTEGTLLGGAAPLAEVCIGPAGDVF